MPNEKKKINVLLVEDDTFLANIYKTKFEMEGFSVTLSEDGDIAMNDIKKKKPDVVHCNISVFRQSDRKTFHFKFCHSVGRRRYCNERHKKEKAGRGSFGYFIA